MTERYPSYMQAGGVACPRFKLGFATTSGVVIGEPNDWRQLQVNLRLSDACDASLQLDGRSVLAGLIVELATDLMVWLGSVLIFRGRITSAEDTLGTDEHTVAVRATDYRGLLSRRILTGGDTLVYTQVPQAEIAWGLISDNQAHTGANLGITRGLIPQSKLRDREYTYDQTIAEALDALSEVIGGFDYNIDPTLRLNVFYPSRGVDTTIPLEYGGNVSAVTRHSGSGDFANFVRLTGGERTVGDTTIKTHAVIASSPTLATDPRGRWDLAVQDSDLKIQSTVDDRVVRLLNDRMDQPDGYDITLAPSVWENLGLNLGDCANLIVHAGRLDLVEQVRITEIAFDVDEDGGYTAGLAAVRCPQSVPRGA